MVAFAQNSRILIAIVSRITNFTEQYPNHHHRDFYYHKRWPFSLCCFCFVGWFPVCLVCCWTFLHKILIIIYWVSLWGIHMNWWSKEESKKKKNASRRIPDRPRKRQNRKVILCSALSFVRFCIWSGADAFLWSSSTSSFRCPYIARVGRLRVIGEQRTQLTHPLNPIRKYLTKHKKKIKKTQIQRKKDNTTGRRRARARDQRQHEAKMNGLECLAQHIRFWSDTYELVFLVMWCYVFFSTLGRFFSCVSLALVASRENTEQHSISRNLTSINDV